mmetsp:Transcript_17184/g.25403  ORF Transcript_17184/g.25403 Transcript_17184/m.25403 type:complete len:84 (-) Transcript_17184:2982-3233(-)
MPDPTVKIITMMLITVSALNDAFCKFSESLLLGFGGIFIIVGEVVEEDIIEGDIVENAALKDVHDPLQMPSGRQDLFSSSKIP